MQTGGSPKTKRGLYGSYGPSMPKRNRTGKAETRQKSPGYHKSNPEPNGGDVRGCSVEGSGMAGTSGPKSRGRMPADNRGKPISYGRLEVDFGKNAGKSSPRSEGRMPKRIGGRHQRDPVKR